MIKFLLPIFLLSIIGIFNLFGVKQNLVVNQFLYVIIGFIVYLVIKKIGRNFFYLNIRVLYFVFVGLLIFTFILGREIRGSTRWLDLYFFNFQSSEIFKSIFILFLSDYLVQNYRVVNSMKFFIKSFLYFSIPTFIIFKQPDLGNAAVYFVIYVTMVFFSDLKKKYILYFLIFLMLITPLGWLVMKDYQRARVTSFFNPQLDQKGTSYNMTQSIITSGSGKFLGRGLGLGTQSRLSFLPENHTDFAFSSLVEQFGFIGGFFTIILFFTVVLGLIRRLIPLHFMRDQQDKKNFLFIIGFLSYVMIQILVNIGMNLGLFPITGIALPFISYGGSSFVALMIGFAFLP